MVGFAGNLREFQLPILCGDGAEGTILEARTALCVDYTNGGFAFLASPIPQLLANMYFALVQLLFRGGFCSEFRRISIADSMRRWCRRNNFGSLYRFVC